jgi:hypothetical protein
VPGSRRTYYRRDRQRLQEMHDMYAFLEEEYRRLRDTWYERQEAADGT